MPFRVSPVLTLALWLTACSGPSAEGPVADGFNRDSVLARKQRVFERHRRLPLYDTRTDTERALADAGLVNVREMDPRIAVRLAYATADNFADTVLYTGIRDAWMLIETAAMLSLAQDELERRRPGHRLVVFDAVRPVSVQRALWARVRGTPQARYVADPGVGSLHNYGAAVDLGILDAESRPLDMGTPFDHFGIEAQPRHETRMLAEGRLTAEQVAHRELLRAVMAHGGFRGIPTEWWHFNAFGLAHSREHFPLIE